jgi:hypothetical protein
MLLGAVIGGFVASFFRIDGGLGVIIGAVTVVVAYALIQGAGGIYSEFAMARQARLQLADWVPAGAAGLSVKADAQLKEGYERKLETAIYFSGSTYRYPLLGVDIDRKRIALAAGERFTPVERNEIRCWRRAEQPAGRFFVVELVAPERDHPGMPSSSRGGATTSASAIKPILTGNCRHGGRSSRGISRIRELYFGG